MVHAVSETDSQDDSIERDVTIRFPQVDPAGIVFYPRYFEMLYRHFAGLPFESSPFAIKVQFLKPNRLGDRLQIAYQPGDDWTVTGRMNGDVHFSVMAAEEEEGATGVPSAFRTADESIGGWQVGSGGSLQLPRYLEMLNMAIEEWFEATLELPFHELHVGRRVGIPTVQFVIRSYRMPNVDENVCMLLQPTRIGGRSMSFTSWLVQGEECLAKTEQVIVFVRMLEDGYESIPIPDYIGSAFEAQVN